MNFVLERLKAVMALAVPSITTAVISAVEKGVGVDIPASWELVILSAVTGFIVHQAPNKLPAAK